MSNTIKDAITPAGVSAEAKKLFKAILPAAEYLGQFESNDDIKQCLALIKQLVPMVKELGVDTTREMLSQMSSIWLAKYIEAGKSDEKED